MKKPKYVAYFAVNNEFEFFDTFEEAEKWFHDTYHDEEEFSDETISGEDFIAEVTHRSKFTEIDNKDNYQYDYEDDIPEDDEESEAWPYDTEYDSVGKVEFEKVK